VLLCTVQKCKKLFCSFGWDLKDFEKLMSAACLKKWVGVGISVQVKNDALCV
jgi:hypothetical protein